MQMVREFCEGLNKTVTHKPTAWLQPFTLSVNCHMHSVETPSMVEHQWNILHWGSRWILITVRWGAVGSEWRTTSVYFGITCVCLISRILSVFAVGMPAWKLNWAISAMLGTTRSTPSGISPHNKARLVPRWWRFLRYICQKVKNKECTARQH